MINPFSEWKDETPKLVKFKGKMIHLRVKTDCGEKYLCNQQFGDAKPSKSTYTESLVTCRNCLRIMRVREKNSEGDGAAANQK